MCSWKGGICYSFSKRTAVQSGVDLSTLRYTIGKDFAIVKIPVSIAEELFCADFYQFTDGTATIVKSTEYTIPASIKDHVDFISGISEFPRSNKVKTHRSVNPQLGVNLNFIESTLNTTSLTTLQRMLRTLRLLQAFFGSILTQVI